MHIHIHPNSARHNKRRAAYTLHNVHTAHHPRYESMVLTFKLQDASINVAYPATMPFSISVPEICKALKEFTEDHTLFAEGLVDQAAAVRKALDGALIQRSTCTGRTPMAS